ncbi:MAG: diadenylate cyclase CdaA [Firmicutes bacterium]|nr:diadenylate cyclase CdaA [Bacillota bacterium]
MQDFFHNIVSEIGIFDVIDILIVAFVIYKILGFIVKTRAVQILKGVLVLIVALIVSDVLDLYTLNWMCKGAVAMGAVAILVVFQPELRRALEYMGRGSFMRPAFAQENKEKVKRDVNQIVRAVDDFSGDHVGALIVFEGQTLLEDIVETGTVLDATISEQLLGNIFYEGSPLHDGAVIIREGMIHAAGCVLPLTGSQEIGKNLGTRHRAGLGITEHSDALVLIVSEETGIISMARDGKMDRFLDRKTVEKQLLDFYLKGGDLSERIEKVPWMKSLFAGIKDPGVVKDKVFGGSSGRNTTQEIPAEELQEAVRKFTKETKDLNELKDLEDLMNDPDLEPAGSQAAQTETGEEGQDA